MRSHGRFFRAKPICWMSFRLRIPSWRNKRYPEGENFNLPIVLYALRVPAEISSSVFRLGSIFEVSVLSHNYNVF